MKNRPLFRRLLPALLCLALLLSAAPALAADAESDGFHYLHDPRLNPRAMEDVVVDPAAVYGFAPGPEGRLKQYMDMDWTDPETVNGENGRQARIAYHESMSRMYDLLSEMTARGDSDEDIARALCALRNELRLASYADDPEGLARVKASNLEKYGHEEGPLPEEQFEKYGSWETVIEKSFSSNPGMDAALGLYDDYYAFYVAFDYVEPERVAAASREYAAAAFMDAAGLTAPAAETADLSLYADAADVSPWFLPELTAAVSAGVLQGYEDGTLRPAATLTRAEGLVLLSRCLPELDALRDPLDFTDVPAWAKADVDRLSAAGLVQGREDGSLGASELLTVEQTQLLAARARGGGRLLSAIAAVNAPPVRFVRHNSVTRTAEVYRDGEALWGGDEYVTAGSAYAVWPDGAAVLYRPDVWIETMETEDGPAIFETLTDPETYAATLASAQNSIRTPDTEVPTELTARDGVLYVTTRDEDPETVAAVLDGVYAMYGGCEYVPGTAIRCVYGLDAETYELLDYAAWLLPPDAAESRFQQITYRYDVPLAAATDPDSPLASYFDPDRETVTLHLTYPSGETLDYIFPEGTYYAAFSDGAYRELFEDEARTEPFTDRAGRTELTLYVGAAAE